MTSATKLKKQNNNKFSILNTSTGYRIRLVPVSGSLLQEARISVEEPDVPEIMNEDKQRKEPNPFDPKYLKAVEDANQQAGFAVIDCMVMFGVEIINEVDEPYEAWNLEKGWERKLAILGKRGIINIKEYDLEDDIDREFLFKKYIALGITDIGIIMNSMGVTGEAIDKASATFPGNS